MQLPRNKDVRSLVGDMASQFRRRNQGAAGLDAQTAYVRGSNFD
jgi:hypothetical protein